MAAELCTPEKPCLVLSLEENDTRREILTVNYDVEQSQFVKLTPELLRWEPEESNEVFNRMFREWLL